MNPKRLAGNRSRVELESAVDADWHLRKTAKDDDDLEIEATWTV